MVQMLPGSATTTHAIRAAIQRSKASAFELDRVIRNYRTGIGKIVSRNITLHVVPWVKAARRKAREKDEGAPE